MVVVFIAGCTSLSFSLRFEATEPPSEIHELSTESPRGGTTEGPRSPVTPAPPSDTSAKFRVKLKGFSCGFMDEGGNELCVSAESGVCVRLIGKRRFRHTIVAVEAKIEAPMICKNRKTLQEVD